MEYYAKLLEAIEDKSNHVFLGQGAEIPLHDATEPVIMALRKKYRQNPESMLITQRGLKFLFAFRGRKFRDESYWRP